MNSTADARNDLRRHGLKPLLFDAKTAHCEKYLDYDEHGWVTLSHPDLPRLTGAPRLRISPKHQFPLIRATFDDLNKALSRHANSPRLEGGQTLRDRYESEVAHYEEMCAATYAAGGFEPDYGTYVFDHRAEDLYLVAPAAWHRLALVTSNAKLLTDPAGRWSWTQIRERLEGAVVGFAGVSVGGNLLEGWLREARPAAVKIADPDWVELTNFNRGERMSLRHAADSRAARFEGRNPFESPRISKAEYVAYEAQLVDPYTDFFVYKDGLRRDNLDRFLGGDGKDEPPIEILVEETDSFELKVLAREAARRHRVDVLMLSDFGHRVALQWNYFRDQPGSRLGVGATDTELARAVDAVRGGERGRVWEFVTALCGSDLTSDSLADFVAGRGEQPTASLPQSGATAMASGGIGGKEIALRVLGNFRDQPSPHRVVYDLLQRSVL